LPEKYDPSPLFERFPEVRRSWTRRQFISAAAAGTAVFAVGGAMCALAGDDLTAKARKQKRADGRVRLPPGQRVITYMKDMGGDEGPSDARSFRLEVHGAVKTPFTVDYGQLLKLPQAEQAADVHCVTGWSLLDSIWKGVTVATLAERAGVKGDARHVIFESHHGFTANVPLAEALAPTVMVTYRVNGKPFASAHGAPVRGLVPDLYFWKSAKWLTGIRFVTADEPGFWEVRGYHNHADPWREERYG
jgi:DMSO/TMAO reductase YedYZ molybdopterin-dependent catalytic subunit